jgi:hypothetical protein
LIQELSDGTRIGFDKRSFVEFPENPSQFLIRIVFAPEAALENSLALSILVSTEIDPQAPGNFS